MAILLGVEFYLVFDRTTNSYEKGLKEGYSMLVVSKKPVKLKTFQKLNQHIIAATQIERSNIVSEVAKGISKNNSEAILKALPYFYNLGLDSYLHTDALGQIKKDLEADENIKKVETFGSSYNSSYRLFSFIKLTLKIFIIFMAVVSLFLIIKQMEIWTLQHQERMYIMGLFGSPFWMKSAVLYKLVFIDSIISATGVAVVYYFLPKLEKFQESIKNIGLDFETFRLVDDSLVLLAISIFITLFSVTLVIFKQRTEVK
jgi:cell division transport system permease protein